MTSYESIPEAQLPASPSMERAVLGALLVEPTGLSDIASFLKPGDFYIKHNGWIFDVMLELHKRGIDIDVMTVCEELDKRGQLDEAGGPAYVTIIINDAANVFHADEYARLVEAQARRRDYIRMASDIAGLAFNQQISLDYLTEQSRRLLDGQARVKSNAITPAELAALDLMEIIARGEPLGLKTGFPVLDKNMGAMPKGETILLVGDASLGKTAFCLQIAETTAATVYQGNDVVKQGRRVLYVSTESKAHTLVARRCCGIIGIPQKLLRTGELSREQADKLNTEGREYQNRFSGTLFFDDISKTVESIERSVAEIQPELVVVDHLSELAYMGDNRTIALLDMFDRLKNMAKRHNAAQIIIHTISADDAFAKDDDEMPNFNSLGWAKDLKYKTDILLGLYASKRAMNTPDVEQRLLWIMKDREGARFQKIPFRFNMASQWYSDAIY